MIYRTEHPKPQFERKNWRNLNGEWQFEFDFGASGAARGMQEENAIFSRVINVPFCPESKLSGIGYTDFIPAVWYKREIELTEADLSGIVRLHFGAVDYEAKVYVNGKLCGSHKGGYVSFYVDIEKFARVGTNVITVYAEDDSRDGMIPSGKQSCKYASAGCHYTRTTGIWQTVWLEFLPKIHIERVKYYPNVESSSLTVEAKLVGAAELTLSASYEGRNVGSITQKCEGGTVTVNLPLSEKHLWEVGKGGLYDLTLTYGADTVKSYFGLRRVHLDGYKFLINGKSVFQRLVLDQGFYPDGIYTAPTDAELLGDVERSVAMGFNGARLHEKVFEERFLYHCDRLGYIVWGEYPNWGLDHTKAESVLSIAPEWIEVLERDFNHPAIIGWCPYNETWDVDGSRQNNATLALIYDITKVADSTRPCIDTSGNYHVKTDVFDVHDYCQRPDELRAHYKDLPKSGSITDGRNPYTEGQLTFVSEYGGICWTDDEKGWGYGEGPKTREEFLERLEGLTDVLLENPYMFGLCYTQLTDVEQEQNGLYTYDRKPKFPPEIISKIFGKKAAIED